MVLVDFNFVSFCFSDIPEPEEEPPIWTVPVIPAGDEESLHGGPPEHQLVEQPRANEAMNVELAKIHGLNGQDTKWVPPYVFQFQVNPGGDVQFLSEEEIV